MDRFIELEDMYLPFDGTTLKSNMDRFIAWETLDTDYLESNFKIQYGQIYREEN